MGLAGPKKQTKISNDPNNTRWTSDTSSFGHKMMISQGWQPGQYLGAEDAAHAEFHTAANASHIRVAIKDDNLGLGAKNGSGVGHGECTGLDAFKNLLGRLNGKDEDEIEKEQRSRDELRTAIYTERRWGATRFVSGGFLIGDKIQHLIDAETERTRKLALAFPGSSSDSSEAEAEAEPEQTEKSKKRKIEALEESEPEIVAVKTKKPKKDKKDREAKAVIELIEESEAKAAKKVKKVTPEVEDISEAEAKRRRKQERREKRQRKDLAKTDADPADDKSTRKERKSKKDKRKEKEDSSETSLSVTKESTPATPVPDSSGRSTPVMMQGRHAVRARNIAQKRMASMDAASLAQIFMIKSS